MLSPLFFVGGVNACLFASFQAVRKAAFGRPLEQLSFAQTVVCGAAAGVLVAPLVGPMELV